MYDIDNIYNVTGNLMMDFIKIITTGSIITFILGSFGLYLILIRIREKFALKAFIPIWRLVVKAKYSNIKPYWFVFCFVPYIGLFYFLLLKIIIDFKFTKALGVSTMIAFISIIFSPFVYLYLAISGNYIVPYYNNQLRFDRKVNRRF